MMFTHLDLCSGIGGFALAARWHGMQTIGFCEIDPWCRRVLAKNFPGVPHHDDVTTLRGDQVRGWTVGAMDNANVSRLSGTELHAQTNSEPRSSRASVSLITGGYPCQPFSVAGKRMGTEDDRHLWPYIAALVADLRPRWCLFENVAGHISLGLDGVLSDLEEIGYTCWPVVVPACALNAPHRRDRVWILAHATDGGIRRGGTPGDTGQSALGSEAHADTTAPGLQGGTGSGVSRAGWTPVVIAGGNPREAEPGLGGADDGLPGRLDERLARPWGDDWEHGVPRVTDRYEYVRSTRSIDRVNKLKALGNAIVPQVAYTLMGAMLDAA